MDHRIPTIIIAGAALALGVAVLAAAAFQGGPYEQTAAFASAALPQAPPVLPGISDAPPGGLKPAQAVLSPLSRTSVKFEGGKVAIAYGAPSMRKRVIFGDLVPFGAVWRAGANDATALHTDLDLKLNGLDVPKGDYTLFVWVDPKQWQLIVNKQTGQSGLEYDRRQDFGRVPMQMSQSAKPIERFRINLSRPDKSDRGQLELAWEKTIATVDFSVHPK